MAFAALRLVRGSLVVGGVVSGAAVLGASSYAIKVTAGIAPRPMSREGKRIERDITITLAWYRHTASTLRLQGSTAAPAPEPTVPPANGSGARPSSKAATPLDHSA